MEDEFEFMAFLNNATLTVDAEVEISYIIYRGTKVWLVIGGMDEPMITERDVVYTRKDIIKELDNEYHFRLPPNNKQAEWLIARKNDVSVLLDNYEGE